MSAVDAPGLIGLAMRAGRLTLGEEGCLDAIRADKAALILIDEGVSPGTLKKFRDASAYHRVELVMLKAGQLGRSVGRPNRRTAVVQDAKLAEGILQGIRRMSADEDQ
ncbi:MAG: L7Ae/L30e/S12e/Gadd45 family ribosomal protein [Candidatus Fimadaptatus sp.]